MKPEEVSDYISEYRTDALIKKMAQLCDEMPSVFRLSEWEKVISVLTDIKAMKWDKHDKR